MRVWCICEGCGYSNGEKRIYLGDFLEVEWIVLICWLDVEDEGGRGRKNDVESFGLVSFIEDGLVKGWEVEWEEWDYRGKLSVGLDILSLRNLWNI